MSYFFRMVLQFFEEPEKALIEAAFVLKRGGRIAIIDKYIEDKSYNFSLNNNENGKTKLDFSSRFFLKNFVKRKKD